MFSKQELKRYNRHIILSEVGKEGQEKLKNARVLVVGAGGLGCPVLQYLVAAGVGTIGIVDADRVDESNLQRQILYNVEDIGKPKALTAAQKLSFQNPYIKIKAYNEWLSKDNILDILKEYDIVVDGSDNFPTRYLVNDASVMLDKVLVFGSIYKFEGQVSVFNYSKGGVKGPTYRCLFPEPPAPEDVPNCSQIGVIGVLPGLIGTMQANEVIKIILGLGDVLSGRVLVADLLENSFNVLGFKAIEENFTISEFVDYEEFCNPSNKHEEIMDVLKSINVNELKWKVDQGEDIQLLDVREDFEREICQLDGIHIPMNQIPANIEKIDREKPVVIYCHHGMRSANVQKYLADNHGFTNLYNLEGGIHAWAEEIDEEMEKY